ncbi:MarR family winged helix-turn-helix transcriptional regulator [Kineococcus rhizosphaerae]|uniref:DNA-binding MarR family transcriptional regulator n=1 Tax=Kineococcus rhizosphaerae TaxID=559628 RepID=A0A2T0RAH1_9ACTN|nr:MarR family transcriptional regulator [Kineococcus rhizosphaerae]PRY18155.1 DNA-binding MarR family transcriptional regulator [Kineococcus rhizosphaerae]
MPTEGPPPSRDAPSDAVRAAHDLRVLLSRLRRRLLEVQGSDDLPAGAISVLLRLDKDGPSTAAALAAAERIRPQSTAATIAALQEQGLVDRRPDPDDGRRLLVDLTAAGRDRVAGDRAARGAWLTQAFQTRYSDGERAEVVRALALLERLLAE